MPDTPQWNRKSEPYKIDGYILPSVDNAPFRIKVRGAQSWFLPIFSELQKLHDFMAAVKGLGVIPQDTEYGLKQINRGGTKDFLYRWYSKARDEEDILLYFLGEGVFTETWLYSCRCRFCLYPRPKGYVPR